MACLPAHGIIFGAAARQRPGPAHSAAAASLAGRPTRREAGERGALSHKRTGMQKANLEFTEGSFHMSFHGLGLFLQALQFPA